MKREKAYEISNILLLKLEKDIKGRKEDLLSSLCFLLVKVTFPALSISIAISILGEGIKIKLRL